MSSDALEETFCEIIRALMPHSATSDSIPANSFIICYGKGQPAPEKCGCGYPIIFHEENRGLLAELFSKMFSTDEPELEVLGKLAPWMENTPDTAISLPASITDNDSLIELENTTEVLIINHYRKFRRYSD